MSDEHKRLSGAMSAPSLEGHATEGASPKAEDEGGDAFKKLGPSASEGGGFKRFVARRKESLANIVHRGSRTSSSSDVSVPSPLFGRKSSVSLESDAPEALVLRQASMLVLERRKPKSQVFVLSTASLRAADGSARVPLRDVAVVTAGGSDALSHSFELTLTGVEKTVVLGAETEEERNEWILVLGAACAAFGGSTLGVVSHSLRVHILGASLERCTGGIVKREEIDEEWQYRKSGALILQGKTPVTYQWDGCALAPTKGAAFGRGTFDGLLLMWYAPLGVPMGSEKAKKKKGKKRRPAAQAKAAEEEEPASAAPAEFEREPSMTFLWCPADRAYYWMEKGAPVVSDARNWKWSRHFLAKCQGLGHWISEGSCPEHVVMLVQLCRYQRMGFPAPAVEATNEAEEAGEPRASAATEGGGDC